MNTKTPLIVLVTGATGHQGGALARLLVTRGHKVRAFTRKPNSPAAQGLKQLGAEVIGGKFDDRSSLEKAMRGVDAVFAVTTPYEAGVEAEVRHGTAISDAARAAGAGHLVYTSVASANRGTGIPHFESKYKVEQYIRGLGIPYTIIGPVSFMENILSPWSMPALQGGRLEMGLPAGRTHQQVAVQDIAGFASRVLEQPERFHGKRIDIASDEVTWSQAAEILSYVTGRRIEYREIPLSEARGVSEDFARMLEWMDRVGYSADIASLRRDYPEVEWHGYEQWARTLDWEALLTGKKAA